MSRLVSNFLFKSVNGTSQDSLPSYYSTIHATADAGLPSPVSGYPKITYLGVGAVVSAALLLWAQSAPSVELATDLHSAPLSLAKVSQVNRHPSIAERPSGFTAARSPRSEVSNVARRATDAAALTVDDTSGNTFSLDSDVVFETAEPIVGEEPLVDTTRVTVVALAGGFLVLSAIGMVRNLFGPKAEELDSSSPLKVETQLNEIFCEVDDAVETPVPVQRQASKGGDEAWDSTPKMKRWQYATDGR